MNRWIPRLVAVGFAAGLVCATGAQAAPAPKSGGTQGTPTHFASGGKAASPGALAPSSALSNYSVQSASFTANSGVQTSGDASCPAGTVVLGGGVFISGSDLSENVNSSWPATNTDWRGYVDNNSGSSTTFTVYAECATAPKGYTIVANSADNPAGAQTTDILAACPSGDKVLGGGGVLSSFDVATALNSSIPVENRGTTPPTYEWRIDANNASSSDDTAYSYAVCGKAITGYKLLHSPAKPNPAGHESFAARACPAISAGQTVPLGGGVFSSSGSTSVNINGTFPYSAITGWGAYENNASAGNATMEVWAICAL